MSRRTAARIRADLEERGVAPELSGIVSRQLERLASDLTPEAYEAVLTGVAAAHAPGTGGAERAAGAGLAEMQRLLGDFAQELKKLDEALETLAAYVLRMRAQATPRDRLLH